MPADLNTAPGRTGRGSLWIHVSTGHSSHVNTADGRAHDYRSSAQLVLLVGGRVTKQRSDARSPTSVKVTSLPGQDVQKPLPIRLSPTHGDEYIAEFTPAG